MSALAATGAGAEAEADAGADASRARHAPRVPRAPEGGPAAVDHQLPDINLNNNPVLHQAAGHPTFPPTGDAEARGCAPHPPTPGRERGVQGAAAAHQYGRTDSQTEPQEAPMQRQATWRCWTPT